MCAKKVREVKEETESVATEQVVNDGQQDKYLNGILVRPLNTFVYMDKTFRCLTLAFMTKKNAFLFGPGGHGKSEAVVAWYRNKGIEPFVVACHNEMTVPELFGGFDVKKFEADGVMHALVDNGFINHEYVIFEELGDLPDGCLAALKDTLTSGIFRNGDQQVPIKTKFIVGCSNRTYEEIGKNQSLNAAMERFPMTHEVKWDSYLAANYKNLIAATHNQDPAKFVVDEIFLSLLEKIGVELKKPISPRIALVAYDVLMASNGNFDDLTFVKDMDSPKVKTLIADVVIEAEQKELLINLIDDITKAKDNFTKEITLNTYTLQSLEQTKKQISAFETKLNKIKVKDNSDILTQMLSSARKKVTMWMTNCNQSIQTVKSNDTIVNLAFEE